MSNSYFCFNHDQLEEALQEFRGWLIEQGRTPEEADLEIRQHREFLNSDAAKNHKLIQFSGQIKTT